MKMKTKREYMDPSILENMGQFCFEDSGKNVSVSVTPNCTAGHR